LPSSTTTCARSSPTPPRCTPRAAAASLCSRLLCATVVVTTSPAAARRRRRRRTTTTRPCSIDALLPPSVVDGAAAAAVCLAGVEEALQAPALLPEHGETAGLDNRRVAACAYFYLALVRCAQGDAWQMAMDLLQAVAVCPAAVAATAREDGGAHRAPGLAPRALWEGLFDEGVLARAGGAGEDDAARRAARRYKDWLMYYKVVAADGAQNGG
jgi:hypothetical protein